MQLIGGIKKLLHDDGLTIKGAQKLLREHGVKHVADLSQPLEDDLLDADAIEEAAYEPDAQPEPTVEAPATVLSFPNRAETPKAEVTAPVLEPQSPPAPVQETPPPAPSEDTQTPVPASEPDAASSSESAPADAQPFGNEELPAFLRRSPPAPPAQDQIAAPSGEAITHENAASAEKVTINPEAHLVPVAEPDDEPSKIEATTTEAEQSASESPAQAPKPIFSHRMNPETPTPEAVSTPEPETAAKVSVDVPSVAKIAPVYFRLGEGMHLTWMLSQASGFNPKQYFQTVALRTLISDINDIQMQLTINNVKKVGVSSKEDISCCVANPNKLEKYHSFIAELKGAASSDALVAMLTIAVRRVREFVA